MNKAMNDAMASIVGTPQPLTIIDSPPGAGKTWFCEHLVALAIRELGLRVCYVAPKVDQGADMARRLLSSSAAFGIDVLVGQDRTSPTISWDGSAGPRMRPRWAAAIAS